MDTVARDHENSVPGWQEMSVYVLFEMKYRPWFVVLEPRFGVPRLK
jgi:hypothetical protein